jgi:hypothetical protein
MENKSSCTVALPEYTYIGCDGKPLPKESVKGTETNPLELSELSDDLKQNIAEKFKELKKKWPHMTRDRLMRKAGEFYKIKFIIE